MDVWWTFASRFTGRFLADWWTFARRLGDVCSPIARRILADCSPIGGRLFADLVDVCSPIGGRLQSANKRPNISRYLGMFPYTIKYNSFWSWVRSLECIAAVNTLRARGYDPCRKCLFLSLQKVVPRPIMLGPWL